MYVCMYVCIYDVRCYIYIHTYIYTCYIYSYINKDCVIMYINMFNVYNMLSYNILTHSHIKH